MVLHKMGPAWRNSCSKSWSVDPLTRPSMTDTLIERPAGRKVKPRLDERTLYSRCVPGTSWVSAVQGDRLAPKAVVEKERVVVRFAGDSGDGMQLTGDRFTNATAVLGNDLATLPDFPAEIRAPAGTLA